MPKIDADLMYAVSNLDAVVLAIFFIGCISLGVIWLASLIIKNRGRDK